MNKRGSLSLLVLFLTTTLTLACLRCWQKSQLVTDLFLQRSKGLQQMHMIEWLFEAGITLVKKNFTTFNALVVHGKPLSTTLSIADDVAYRQYFSNVASASLILKKPAYISDKQLLIVLQLYDGNNKHNVAYCLLKQVGHAGAKKFIISHYTLRVVV